ncbi:YqaJ domain containing protein, partial [Asbolus verrucosus]
YTCNRVKSLLYSKSGGQSSNYPKRIHHDIVNAAMAIEAFENMYNLRVTRCGLFVDQKKKKNFAAFPDGLIGNDGIIEVKCLYSAQNLRVEEAIENKVINIAQ